MPVTSSHSTPTHLYTRMYGTRMCMRTYSFIYLMYASKGKGYQYSFACRSSESVVRNTYAAICSTVTIYVCVSIMYVLLFHRKHVCDFCLLCFSFVGIFVDFRQSATLYLLSKVFPYFCALFYSYFGKVFC